MNVTFDREAVLKKIDEATLEEEKALPVYTSHISSALFWSGLPKETQEQIVAKLKILHDDSVQHVLMLAEVRKIYSETK